MKDNLMKITIMEVLEKEYGIHYDKDNRTPFSIKANNVDIYISTEGVLRLLDEIEIYWTDLKAFE